MIAFITKQVPSLQEEFEDSRLTRGSRFTADVQWICSRMRMRHTHHGEWRDSALDAGSHSLSGATFSKNLLPKLHELKFSATEVARAFVHPTPANRPLDFWWKEYNDFTMFALRVVDLCAPHLRGVGQDGRSKPRPHHLTRRQRLAAGWWSL